MDLTNCILNILSKTETYKEVKQYIKRLGDKDQAVYKPICDAIVLGLTSKGLVISLMAAKLGMQSVEQENSDFNEMFQELCLPYYEKIAEFKKDVHNDERGKYYYSETPNKDESIYGKSLLTIILESIETWATLYPCQSDQNTQSAFLLTYSRLKEKKIKFPDQHLYFKKYQIKKQTEAIQEFQINFNSIQQKHKLEVSNLMITMLENQEQEFKRKEIRYKEIEQQYLDLQNQRDSSSSLSEDFKTIKNSLIDQITTLNSQNEQLQSLHQNDNLEMEKMRSQISELKEENEMMKQEIEALKQQHQIEKNQLINQIQQQEKKN